MPSEFIGPGKKKKPNQQDVKNKKPKLNIFSDKVYDAGRSIWRRGCFAIARSLSLCSNRALCHPWLTAVARNTHRDGFPAWRWLPQAPQAADPVIRRCCTAEHHPCASPAPSRCPQTQGHSAASGRLHQGRQHWQGYLNSHTNHKLFLVFWVFFNKGWAGEEAHGSGHALIDSFLNCHGLNNMPRPRCQYWYSVF